MKKTPCLLPLLAAALFAVGCAQPASTVPQSSVPASTSETASEPPSAPPRLQELTASANGYYYLQSIIDETGRIFLTTVDLNDGQQRVLCNKPGCSHSDENCWAYVFPDSITRSSAWEAYTDGTLLYFVYLTDYQHFGMDGAQPESAIFISDLTGPTRPLAEMAAQSPNYCANFLQDGAYLDGHWFTDGETLWALITSNPHNAANEQTFAATLYHFVPAPEGAATPYTAEVVWRQVRDGSTTYAGLLDGQIVLQLEYPGPDTGSLADNYKLSTSELRVLSCDGALGEPLLTFLNGDWQGGTLLNGQRYAVPANSTDLTVTDLRTGDSRTLCTLPIQADALSVTPQLIYEGRLVVDVSQDTGDTRYVIDTTTGAMTTLPATWAKDGAIPRVPVFRQIAQNRCLMLVGTQDRMLTTMGQDGGTYTFNSPLSVYAVADLGDYLDGDQNWQICSLLDPDAVL